jgi:hypothetical protein
MPKRTAAGVLLSDDGMWWWDGSRWHPATGSTSGRPPRAPGSPWPWIIGALVALGLITALPIWLLWGRGTGPAAANGFDRGYAHTYLPQRQTAISQLQQRLADLDRCELTTAAPCTAAADALAGGARDEAGTVQTEAGLFYFPACLKSSAQTESEALLRVQNDAASIRILPRSQGVAIQRQLNAIAVALRQAGAAVATSPCG